MITPHPVTTILAHAALAGLALLMTAGGSHAAPAPCRIEVVEKGSGWPVPLVQMETTSHVKFVTDNAGVVAFDLPEFMGRETWFSVVSDGYEMPKDGFGNRGVRLTPEPGKTLKVEVSRTIIAKRLGRITGSGLFAESQKTGHDLDWQESGVVGCDTVQNALLHGQMFWLWGDTGIPSYPLGIFDSSGALSDIQPVKQFEPPLKLKLNLFTNAKGAPRGIAKMPGPGPTWLGGCISLPDRDGKMHLCAIYSKIRGFLDVYESGLCVWNDQTENFDPYKVIWKHTDATPKRPTLPEGHTNFWTDAAGKKWVLFGNPFPNIRCPATFEGWADPTQWELLKPQATVPSAADAQPITPHSGSITWNGFRKRWVAVFEQAFGKPSSLGELWYAEADSPTGPWGPAVKVLTHQNYTFYNVKLHPEFTAPDSRILLFEGTYTATFADHPEPTPRYDYNQMLYRLDMDDPALAGAQKGAP